MSALQSCISPKISINPSLEYPYSLLDTQAVHWSCQDSIWPRRACLLALLCLGATSAAPAQAPDTVQTWRASRWGGEEKKGDAHLRIFHCLHSRPLWFCGCGMIWKEPAQLCARDLRSDRSPRAGRTLCSPANTNTSLTPSLSLSPAPSNYTTPAIIGSPILLLE